MCWYMCGPDLTGNCAQQNSFDAANAEMLAVFVHTQVELCADTGHRHVRNCVDVLMGLENELHRTFVRFCEYFNDYQPGPDLRIFKDFSDYTVTLIGLGPIVSR